MTFLYRRGEGSRRRVMHITLHDPRTAQPLMLPMCRIPMNFNTTCNLPLGQPICKRCLKLYGGAA